MRRNRQRGQGGFTLLEAVVALTILASAGLALYASLNSSLIMVDRAARSQRTDVAVMNALAWLETINPMLTPEAEENLGEYQLRWRAELIEPVRQGETGYLQPGHYDIGLYRVRAELWLDGERAREFEVRRVGYRQMRYPAKL